MLWITLKRFSTVRLCTMFGHLLGWYTVYTFLGLSPPNGILPGAKFALRPSLAFSWLGSITARHWSSRRQPNFAAWYKKWRYGTFAPHHFQQRAPPIFRGRPSRLAEAHTVVIFELRISRVLTHTEKYRYSLPWAVRQEGRAVAGNYGAMWGIVQKAWPPWPETHWIETTLKLSANMRKLSKNQFTSISMKDWCMLPHGG